MILKSILSTVVLLCVYSYFLSIFETPSASQNQNQDNLVKAQQYMFNKKVPKNVIVGTSLSCHIHTDSLDDFYNLSFNGSSIYDGLNVILNGVKFPKNVFIESNLYLKEKSELLYNQLYDVYPYYSAKYLNVVRVENQPIGKVIHTLNPLGDRIVERHNLYMKRVHDKLYNSSKLSSIYQASEGSLFDKMLKLQIQNFSVLPSQSVLNNKLKELEVIVNVLKRKHIQVFFFEMPINKKLINSIRVQYLRQKLRAKFDSRVTFTDQDTTCYQTSDGVHLNELESIQYTRFFKNVILKN
jgi:hypothetical protein